MFMQKLPEIGVAATMVPEAATTILTSGIKIQEMLESSDRYFEFQREVVRMQLANEERFKRLTELRPGSRKVIICDRGVMDGKAYMDPELFDVLLREEKSSVIEMRDMRYDGILHLVTAADGAEEFYNLNNPARYETDLEEVRKLDKRTQAAWQGHEHWCAIPNRTNDAKPIPFDEKMDILFKKFCHLIGVPAPLEIENKYLVSIDTDPTQFPLDTKPVMVNISQTYLRASPEAKIERRIRRREQDGGILCVYTEKEDLRKGVRVERERVVSEREYRDLYQERAPFLCDIKKRRYAFAWQHQYFQLDLIDAPMKLAVLEIELTEENDKVTIPPFVKILKEVTEDRHYKNASIAADTCPGYE